MRGGLNLVVVVGLLIALGACADVDPPSDNSFLVRFAASDPSHDNFFECYGYGCKYRTRITLTDEEWQEVQAEFDPPAQNPPGERWQIAQAVALLELMVGERTGTSAHQLHSRFNYGDSTQMDCIDNSVNTWTYLTMFGREGLLRYHEAAGLAHRGSLMFMDFTNTAVFVEKGTGAAFAIDPWLTDSGVPPPIYPLAMWEESE